MIKKLQNGSDVRGVALCGIESEKVNLTPKETFLISISFAKWLSKKTGKDINNLKIGIGNDSRLSANTLKEGVFNGLNTLGIEFFDCGLASTPSMFMSCIYSETNFDGSIMLTASHLPFNRNGMKFFTKNGGLDKEDISEILNSINEEFYANHTYSTNDIFAKTFDLISLYSQSLVKKIQTQTNSLTPLEGMKIIVDAGNGSGGFFVDKVLKVLGANTDGSQFLEPDGNFPNHIPNPEDKDAINSIVNATKKAKADLGIIFDTDVDRAAVIDSSGKAINRNKLIALMSAIVLKENKDSTIVTDSVTSDGLTKFIERLGGTHHRFKRGYKNVINESIRLNKENVESSLAIETSGHGAFKENYFLDDGAYIVTKVLICLSELSKNGQKLGSIIDSLEEPQDSLEIRMNINDDNFKEYGQNVLNSFRDFAKNNNNLIVVSPNYEGVKVNYNINNISGWILLRLSLHDPVIPINLESNLPNGCEVAYKLVQSFLSQFDKLN